MATARGREVCYPCGVSPGLGGRAPSIWCLPRLFQERSGANLGAGILSRLLCELRRRELQNKQPHRQTNKETDRTQALLSVGQDTNKHDVRGQSLLIVMNKYH